MRFICDQTTLVKAINTVSKAVTTRTTIPILKGILLTLKENELTLAASDLEISIEKTIMVKGEEEGSLVVSSKLFSDIIRKLPNEDILVYGDEKEPLTIKTSTSEFHIIALQSEEFPKMVSMEEEKDKVVFEKEMIKDMIRKTAFSASVEESKGIIVGVLIEREKESINMVALDGFRMAVVRQKIENDKEDKMIISAKLMNEISKIIGEEEGEGLVEMFIDKKKIFITLDNTKVVLRLLEGEFIKYKDILPKDKKTKILVNKNLLQDAIERASLLSREGKNNLVKFTIEDNLLTITSKSEEGNVKEEIIIEKEGDNLEIGFNHKYILDVIKAVDDEIILMEYNTPTSPCMIKQPENTTYEYLILPVRING
jgi:DNA polymerase-3 subunit beta